MTPEEQEAEDQAAALKAKHEIVHGKIAPVMIDAVLDVVTKLAKPFGKLSETQQNDLIMSISSRIKTQLHAAIPLLAQGVNDQRIGVHLKDFSVKEGDINLKLETGKTLPALALLGGVSSVSELHLFIADTRMVDDQSQKVKVAAQPDQGDLLADDEEEEAPPEPPSDDDLAEAGEAVAEEETTE